MICILNILFNHPVSEATPNSKITGAQCRVGSSDFGIRCCFTNGVVKYHVQNANHNFLNFKIVFFNLILTFKYRLFSEKLLTNVAVSIAEYVQNRLQSCAECHIDKTSATLLKKSAENKWRGQKFCDQIFSKFFKQEAPETSFQGGRTFQHRG